MSKPAKTPSSVLVSLMDEYGLNPSSLSKEIGLSYAAVRMLAIGELKISVPTALRLAKFFSNSPDFWLSLQQEADLAEAGKDKELQSALNGIKKAAKQTTASKAIVKSRRKTTLSDKRKAAAKIPGSKTALRKKK